MPRVMTSSHDRAAAVTTAILQIFFTAPERRLRQAIEAYLRGEFADERRQAMADRELPDDA